ncbi:HotDog domain-containing protein [Aspergillus germanicus]
MRSRTFAVSPTYLSRRSYFSRTRILTVYRPNECHHNGIRQHAARQVLYKQTGCGQRPFHHRVHFSTSAPAPLSPFQGINNQTQRVAEDLISSLPLTRYLRSLASASSSPEPSYTESRPYRDMHPAAHTTHLVSASLLCETKLPTDPIFFLKTQAHPGPDSAPLCNAIATCYIGSDLCGHPGFVHGGLSFVLFDDVFARCAAAVLKSRTAMTASMSVDFRAPASPNRVYVYRVRIVEQKGRKVWMQGEMRCLRAFDVEEMTRRGVALSDGVGCEEVEGTLVAEAKALFVEPKNMEVGALY